MKKSTSRERRNSYPENFFKSVKKPELTDKAMNLESLRTVSPVHEDSLADIVNRNNAKQAAITQKLQSWQDAIHSLSLKTMSIAEENEEAEDEPVEAKGFEETAVAKGCGNTF